MKVFRVDSSKLADHLEQLSMSYQTLAEKLNLFCGPSKRTIQEIKYGRVSRRWQKAVADLLGISERELYDQNRVIAQHLDAVKNHPHLDKIRINYALTKSAVSLWLTDDGGIEPEHLDALARILGVRPVDLVSNETEYWMREFLRGGKATPPDD